MKNPTGTTRLEDLWGDDDDLFEKDEPSSSERSQLRPNNSESKIRYQPDPNYIRANSRIPEIPQNPYSDSKIPEITQPIILPSDYTKAREEVTKVRTGNSSSRPPLSTSSSNNGRKIFEKTTEEIPSASLFERVQQAEADAFFADMDEFEQKRRTKQKAFQTIAEELPPTAKSSSNPEFERTSSSNSGFAREITPVYVTIDPSAVMGNPRITQELERIELAELLEAQLDSPLKASSLRFLSPSEDDYLPDITSLITPIQEETHEELIEVLNSEVASEEEVPNLEELENQDPFEVIELEESFRLWK